MPVSNTEMDSLAQVDVDSENNEMSGIILSDSEDDGVTTFTDIPRELESSNSSMNKMESEDNTRKIQNTVPMLTDVAEETVYETEFFEGTLREDFTIDKNLCITDEGDISNILMETIIGESNDNTSETEVYEQTTILEQENDSCKGSVFINDELCRIESENDLELNGDNECIIISDCISEPSTSEVSNLITVSNNTNLVSEILENSALNNIHTNELETVNLELVNEVESHNASSLSNIIQIGAINNSKVLRPVTVQSGFKFVPVSIAPANVKRPAAISVGQSPSNIVTKVVVSQGKLGQPFVITNSPSKPNPICILSNTSNPPSPVKSITAAQAKQMGFKLQTIRPSSNTIKQNVVLSNVIPPGAQMLRKVQSLTKTTVPAKILPAPLVSKSSTSSKGQNIILHPDYLMKNTTKATSSGQVINISNLQTSTMVSNIISPKRKVQYIKLGNNIGSTNVPTVSTAKTKIAVAQTTNVPKIDKDTPIIVASSNFIPNNLTSNGGNVLHTNNATPVSGITVLSKSTPGQRLILPAVTKPDIVASQTPITETKPMKQSNELVVLPGEILEKLQEELTSTPTRNEDLLTESIRHQEKEEIVTEQRTTLPLRSPPRFGQSSYEGVSAPGNGLKSRKPCNCTRSQCLKLYCECFANGEFCNNCNCVSCHNNISHEENRQSAIQACLVRNPQAFRPKIGKCLVGLNDRRHTKGCHCKRSGCLKNYCECYEAQIPCSENCKCVGCKNIDDMLFATTCSTNSNNSNFDKTERPFEFQTFSKNKLTAEINDAVGQSGSNSQRHAFSFIKDQVVEATCQCLLAQAEDIKRRNISPEEGKKYILEEFGRCLIQIIECAPEKYSPS